MILTFFHLFLLAFKLGGNVTGALLGENTVVARQSQVCRLRRRLAAGGPIDIVEVLVMRESLEADGSSRTGRATVEDELRSGHAANSRRRQAF